METQQVATPTDATSLEDRIFSKAGLQPEPEPTPEPESQPAPAEGDVQADEPVEVPQEEAFDFELTHNGQLKKLTSKDELRQLAQKGYDYEHNIVRAKEEYRKAQSMGQAVQAQLAMQPQILDALAEAKSFETQLKGYANVNWAEETQTDPIGAFQKRMQYDQLAQGYATAMQKAQYIGSQFQQASQHVDKTRAELEATRMKEAIPEWRDDAIRQKEGREVLQTLQRDYGFSTEEIQAMERSGILFDHRFIRLMRDSWKYRQASDPKARKVPQGLPSAKPQARANTRSEGQSLADVKRALHQPNISKDQRKVAEDELIARRFKL